jgi:hypothetical protein
MDRPRMRILAVLPFSDKEFINTTFNPIATMEGKFSLDQETDQILFFPQDSLTTNMAVDIFNCIGYTHMLFSRLYIPNWKMLTNDIWKLKHLLENDIIFLEKNYE